MLLAIDTSTNFASLALADGATLLAELNWRVGQRHGSETLERARWLLRGQGVTMSQLDGIAVALGPGSFNGVRVAVTTAKTLAFALGIPLYGIPTLDVIAWGARLAPEPIWSLLDAGRGEIFAACYHAQQSLTTWAPQPLAADATSPYIITHPQALSARIDGLAIFTGEWRESTRATLAEALGERARFTSPLMGRRGAWLAEIATMRAQRIDADDPRALEPLYLRRPAITSSARPEVSPSGAGVNESSAADSEKRDGEETARAV